MDQRNQLHVRPCVGVCRNQAVSAMHAMLSLCRCSHPMHKCVITSAVLSCCISPSGVVSAAAPLIKNALCSNHRQEQSNSGKSHEKCRGAAVLSLRALCWGGLYVARVL